MESVELNEQAMQAARREAERRGVDVSGVVTAAVQRFFGDPTILGHHHRKDDSS